jgi:hypothetical protein
MHELGSTLMMETKRTFETLVFLTQFLSDTAPSSKQLQRDSHDAFTISVHQN